MNPRKRKRSAPAVPEWVVTYGDLMSLLLCFFILLAAFSELKQEREYRRVWDSLRKAFGYVGGSGSVPSDIVPENSNVEEMNQMALPGRHDRTTDLAQIQSTIGDHTRVENIREGLRFTIGGAVAFEAGSFEVPTGMQAELLKLTPLLQGRKHRIVVRGHAMGADRTHAPAGTGDVWDLSFRRAKSVAFFMRDHGHIEERLITLEAAGDTEPAEVRRYTPEDQAVNRRVQIILTEIMVDEIHPDANYTGRAMGMNQPVGQQGDT